MASQHQSCWQETMGRLACNLTEELSAYVESASCLHLVTYACVCRSFIHVYTRYTCFNIYISVCISLRRLFLVSTIAPVAAMISSVSPPSWPDKVSISRSKKSVWLDSAFLHWEQQPLMMTGRVALAHASIRPAPHKTNDWLFFT